MSRDALIVGEKSHHLGPECAAAPGGHGSKEATVFCDRHDLSQRLLHLPGRELSHRLRHRRDQIFHPQPGPDLLFIEKLHH